MILVGDCNLGQILLLFIVLVRNLVCWATSLIDMHVAASHIQTQVSMEITTFYASLFRMCGILFLLERAHQERRRAAAVALKRFLTPAA